MSYLTSFRLIPFLFSAHPPQKKDKHTHSIWHTHTSQCFWTNLIAGSEKSEGGHFRRSQVIRGASSWGGDMTGSIHILQSVNILPWFPVNQTHCLNQKEGSIENERVTCVSTAEPWCPACMPSRITQLDSHFCALRRAQWEETGWRRRNGMYK